VHIIFYLNKICGRKLRLAVALISEGYVHIMSVCPVIKSVRCYLVGPETSDLNRLPSGAISKFRFVTPIFSIYMYYK